MDDYPPPLSPQQADELRRRQRVKNWVLLLVLVGVAALFYAISMVRVQVS